MMNRWSCRIVLLALSGLTLIALTAVSMISAEDSQTDSFSAVSRDYTTRTRPLLKKFCLDCHSTDRQEGELDLERFVSLDHLRKGTQVWLKVAEMLDNGEMPPKNAKQPSADERKQIRGWVERFLNAEAEASAGDPGPVVLRRLNNAQYTYTIRDLTGVALSPAREFPSDSAAGEGFTNAGNALVMSPALLTKYFDAGKEIARHAVLLPDGFRFSPSTNRGDWTNDVLARIRAAYREHTASQGATKVNLQGIVFDTNDGGRLPVEKYVAATLADRDALRSGAKTVETVAREHGVNSKYLGLLWGILNRNADAEPSLLLDTLRSRWRGSAPGDAPALAAEIARWQGVLTKFQSVGHMKSWMTPVSPLVSRQEIRLPLPAAGDAKDVTLYLVVGDAGDGRDGDFAVWQQPRLVAPGRPDLLLRDVRDFTREMTSRRTRLFASTAKSLKAAGEASRATAAVDVNELAKRHNVEEDALAAWLDFLGIGAGATQKLDHFTTKLTSASNYEFIKGWGSHDTPLLLANSTDNAVRVPGKMKPRGVCVHPSPKLSAAIGWRSPAAATLRVSGQVTHAHPECGNGVTWSLELRRGATRQRLATGIAHGSTASQVGPLETLSVQPGDLVSLLIGPRDGNHACDLTDVEFVLKSAGDAAREWSLTRDITDDVLACNPHADRFGNDGVWHFYTEPTQGNPADSIIPAGSVLARWQAEERPDEKQELAAEVQSLLVGKPPADPKHPDAVLYKQLASLGGPLFASAWRNAAKANVPAPTVDERGVGLDPAMFGKHPDGKPIDAASLCVQAASVIEARLPADLAAGAEFVATGVLHAESSKDGSVQMQVLPEKPDSLSALRPGISVLVGDESAAKGRFERSFDDFRRLFPAALCYTKIVPVDEVVTLTLFHREDEPLCRLMLSDAQKQELDRLWDELHFVSHDALTLVDAFTQLMEYATQDSNPALFEPYRKPIHEGAAAFRKALVEAEPRHVEALVEFAAQAYRRPLFEGEAQELRRLYRSLREQELPHEEAFRFTLARVFVSPAFLYRIESAPPGTAAGPVSDGELASRLSYFLWSSQPDAELRKAAAAGKLHDPDVLAAQAKRMLADPRTRRLASEFACQWLHIYDFDTLDEKSEKHFPEFMKLRGEMYEESIRFFTDLFQRDGSVLEILNADHLFVNETLAKHYGVPDVAGPDWRRVDGARHYGRGGILGLAATLAKQSGASRTSPILRGNWISEVLLGEKLPKPPPAVPQLPEDETATENLTVRQLVEKHSSDEKCARCHVKIDPYGHALEGFDAIGRRRDKDLAGRSIDSRAKLQDGTEFSGIDGLREHLVTNRRDAFVRQFCRKLLGYALGRGVQLSDEPLLKELRQKLEQNDHRFGVALETIIRSRQFREIRGRDAEVMEAQ